MKKLYRLTQSGVDELKEELKNLIAQRVPIADRIGQARQLGDLSENAEYQSARNEQDRLEGRISEVDHILKNVQIIQKPKADGLVRLGSTVKLQNEKGKSHEFQIVGTMEADPMNGKVSDESPIGRELLGKKQGEEAHIKTPSETTAYTIVNIS